MPNMAIVDADFHMTAPKGLTAASGIDAVTHALEAYASMMATEYTDGLAIEALKNIFEYLPRAYDDGLNDPVAREKMAMQHQWQVWHFQTHYYVFSTKWPISKAHIITNPTVLQTHI